MGSHTKAPPPPEKECGRENGLWPSRGESPQSASWCAPVLLWGCSEEENETAKLQKCSTPYLQRRDRYFKPVSSQILQLLKRSQKQSFSKTFHPFIFSYKQRWQESKRRGEKQLESCDIAVPIRFCGLYGEATVAITKFKRRLWG